MTNVLRRVWLPAFVSFVLPAMLIAAAPSSPAGPDERQRLYPSQALAEFTQRVNDYAALHKKLDATLTQVQEQGSPAQYAEHQRALARLLQKVRFEAKRGDIFTRPVRALIRRNLESVFRGPEGKQIKQSIYDEFTAGVRLEINSTYPEKVPVSSMPPQVLNALPKVPDVLEYRFIGSRLILLDSQAHIIVDFMENVFH